MALLQDRRIFVIEYEGGDRVTTDDTKEKRNIGELWAAKSDGVPAFCSAQRKFSLFQKEPRPSGSNRDFDRVRLDAERLRELPLGRREGEDRRGAADPPRRRLLVLRHRMKRHLVGIDPELGEGPVAYGIAPLIPGIGDLDPRVLANGNESAALVSLSVFCGPNGRNPPEQKARAVWFRGIRKLVVGVVAILSAEQPGALLHAGRVEHPRLRAALADDARREHHDGVFGGRRLASFEAKDRIHNGRDANKYGRRCHHAPKSSGCRCQKWDERPRVLFAHCAETDVVCHAEWSGWYVISSTRAPHSQALHVFCCSFPTSVVLSSSRND